jgi:hypothetical protein
LSLPRFHEVAYSPFFKLLHSAWVKAAQSTRLRRRVVSGQRCAVGVRLIAVGEAPVRVLILSQPCLPSDGGEVSRAAQSPAHCLRLSQCTDSVAHSLLPARQVTHICMRIIRASNTSGIDITGLPLGPKQHQELKAIVKSHIEVSDSSQHAFRYPLRWWLQSHPAANGDDAADLNAQSPTEHDDETNSDVSMAANDETSSSSGSSALTPAASATSIVTSETESTARTGRQPVDVLPNEAAIDSSLEM